MKSPTRKIHLRMLTLGGCALAAAVLLASPASFAGIYNRVVTAFYMAVGYQGTGGDGALTVSGIPNGPTNPLYTDNVRTYVSSASASGQANVNVGSSAGFTTGDEVVIIEMIGSNPGMYETAKISSIAGNVLTMTANLTNTYPAYSAGTQDSQVIRVPQYSTVTINSGGYLTVHAFDGQTGGVMFMRASSGVVVNYNATLSGQISVTGKGFSGGGAGAAGSGQAGGAAATGAGSISPSNVKRLVIGSGGGGGSAAGGAGAGAMAILTNATIQVDGNISANGGAAGTGGGGGSGGSLWLVADTIGTSGTCGNMTVNGGAGNGAGTAGAGGQAIIYYRTNMNCHTGAPNANSSYLKYKDK